MNKSSHRRSLPEVLRGSNPFAGGMTGLLLVLCLWLAPENADAAGSSVNVSFTIRNQGTTTANASTTIVRLATSNSCVASWKVRTL